MYLPESWLHNWNPRQFQYQQDNKLVARISHYLYNRFVWKQFPMTDKNSTPSFVPLDLDRWPLLDSSNKGQRFPKDLPRYNIASIAISARAEVLSHRPGKSRRRYSLAFRWQSFEFAIPLENRKYSFVSTYFNEYILMSHRCAPSTAIS